MPDLKIKEAPLKYQNYLTLGDISGNSDATINNTNEAEVAASLYCAVNSAKDCRKFLKYLEGKGYSTGRLLIFQAITKYTNEADYLLPELTYSAFFAKYNIKDVRRMFASLKKSAGKDVNRALEFLILLDELGVLDKIGEKQAIAFSSAVSKYKDRICEEDIELLAKKGVFGKIPIPYLISITVNAGEEARSAYLALAELSEKGLVDRIGPRLLYRMAGIMMKKTGLAYNAINSLYQQDLLGAIGMKSLMTIAQASPDTFFSIADQNIPKKLLDRIGVPNLIQIAKSAGESGRDVVRAISEGLLDKVDMSNVIQIVRNAEEGAGTAVNSISDRLLDNVGQDRLAILSGYAGKLTSNAYNTLDKLIEHRDLFNKIGWHNLMVIAKSALEYTGEAYYALIGLEKGDLIDEIGLQELLRLAHLAGRDTGAAFTAIKMLDDNNLLKTIGFDTLLSIAQKFDKGILCRVYLTIGELSKDHLIDEFGGVENVIKILTAIAQEAKGGGIAPAYRALKELAEKKGLIQKIGVEKLINAARESGLYTYMRYEDWQEVMDLTESQIQSQKKAWSTLRIFINDRQSLSHEAVEQMSKYFGWETEDIVFMETFQRKEKITFYDHDVYEIFPYLIEAAAAQNNKIRRRARTILSRLKYYLEYQLAEYVRIISHRTPQVDFAQSLLSSIKAKRVSTAIFFDGLEEAGYTRGYESPDDVDYFASIIMLRVPDEADYVSLHIIDHKGKDWVQSCNTLGNQLCDVEPGERDFWIFLRKGVSARPAYVEFIRKSPLPNGKESFVTVSHSKTFYIPNPMKSIPQTDEN